MLKQRAGINMTHINYNGSAPALTDVIAGRVPLMFDIWHSAKRYVDSGDLKLIAGAGAQRLRDAPHVPTIAETYPGFDVIAFNALVAPAGVPAPVLDKLSADIRAVVNSPEFADKVAQSRHLPASATRRRSSMPGCARRSRAGRRSPRQPTSRRDLHGRGMDT